MILPQDFTYCTEIIMEQENNAILHREYWMACVWHLPHSNTKLIEHQLLLDSYLNSFVETLHDEPFRMLSYASFVTSSKARKTFGLRFD